MLNFFEDAKRLIANWDKVSPYKRFGCEQEAEDKNIAIFAKKVLENPRKIMDVTWADLRNSLDYTDDENYDFSNFYRECDKTNNVLHLFQTIAKLTSKEVVNLEEYM